MDWHTPREAVAEWCTTILGPLASVETVKIRPWSSVYRVTSAGGDVHFFKENCPGQAFEAAFVQELADIAPRHVVPVTAVDLDRGFLLTPDQGPVLSQSVPKGDIAAHARVAHEGALLQREAAPHLDRLAAAGGLVMRPADAPAYVATWTDRLAALPESDPLHLPHETAVALASHLPKVQEWADQVEALDLPLTLNHNDLHTNNVFARREGMRFFDFGDAVLSEPLAVLLVPLNFLSGELAPPGAEEASRDDPGLRRVANAALEVWSDLAPLAELRAALPAALQLARLGRIASWARCLETFTAAEVAEYPAPTRWLASMLEEPPLTVA